MTRYPEHLVLIDNGVRCNHCKAQDICIPNDIRVVIERMEAFVDKHESCEKQAE